MRTIVFAWLKIRFVDLIKGFCPARRHQFNFICRVKSRWNLFNPKEMKLIFLTPVVLLSSCSSCSRNAWDQHENVIESSQDGEIKREFRDLNGDIWYLIFYRLKLNALLNMLQADSRLSDIANEVVSRKYRNYKFILMIMSIRRTELYEEDDNRVTIYNIPFVLNVLKYFAHNIRALKIRNIYNQMKLDDLIRISEFVNKYCSKSLKNLQLFTRDRIIVDTFYGTIWSGRRAKYSRWQRFSKCKRSKAIEWIISKSKTFDYIFMVQCKL